VKLLRTFIAIELPGETRDYLFQTGRKMGTAVSDRTVRWVSPENMHLTLRFLGDTAADKLPLIADTLDKICADFQPFNLHLDTLGCFPNRIRPRVIWAGLGGDLKTLNSIQHRIEKAIQTMGWPAENRPFQAHLTIGRVKDQAEAGRLAWEQPLEKNLVQVSAVHLIESQLRPNGPVYTINHSANLGKP
jgi:2'-5' RNA ligase